MQSLNSKLSRVFCLAVTAILVLVTAPSTANAHVKWFSEFDWSTKPRTVAETTTFNFWLLLALSVFTLMAMVLLDERVRTTKWAAKISDWFSQHANSSALVMRVATFAVILVAWQQRTLFAPELSANESWIGILQGVLVFLLLWPQLTPLAGLCLAALWFYGTQKFGLFHLLDYCNVLGVAWFLLVCRSKTQWLKATSLPVLYLTVGFSLMWLGCEKLIFPDWALSVLSDRPMLTLGLKPDFFLTSAAFIELSLGFLLMICLFGRTLSIVITLTFVLTTCVFGRVEVIGHTLIHAALIVFLFEGPGRTFTPPAMFHKRLPIRMAFVSVNFVLLVFGVLWAYSVANHPTAKPGHQHPKFDVTQVSPRPEVSLQVTKDSRKGWNIRVQPKNFSFAPQNVGGEQLATEGHVHLYVDGQKVARMYSEWFHIPPLPPGSHTVRATLNANDHSDLVIDGQVIEAKQTITDAN